MILLIRFLGSRCFLRFSSDVAVSIDDVFAWVAVGFHALKPQLPISAETDNFFTSKQYWIWSLSEVLEAYSCKQNWKRCLRSGNSSILFRSEMVLTPCFIWNAFSGTLNGPFYLCICTILAFQGTFITISDSSYCDFILSILILAWSLHEDNWKNHPNLISKLRIHTFIIHQLMSSMFVYVFLD